MCIYIYILIDITSTLTSSVIAEIDRAVFSKFHNRIFIYDIDESHLYNSLFASCLVVSFIDY